MLQTAVISDKAKAIVNNLLWEVRKEDFLSEPHRKIIVSLYASMPQANPEITKLLLDFKVDLLRFITKEELDVLKSEYSDVIQFCYETYGKDGSFYVRKENKNSWAPKGLIDLCLSIAQPKVGASIYLPFSGEAQFGYYLPNCEFEGFETDTPDWAFSRILLDSKGIKADISLVDHDKICQTTKDYNYIFTIPPFANGRELKERFIIDQLYHLATKSLKPNGEMYCILPMAFCNASHGWFDLRKILFDKFPQFSAAVISLPKIFYPLSSINLCLFVLMRDNQNRVILMDASGSEFFATHDIAGYTEVELKVESIIETIKKEDEQYLWVGYPTELTDSLNLTPSRYLVSKAVPRPRRGERIVSLNDLIEIVSREKIEVSEQGYKLIDMKALPKSYLDCEIKNQDIDIVSLPKPAGMRIRKLGNNDCMLFTYRNGKAFVARLSDFPAETIVAIPGITIPFKLKSTELITEDFLLRSLVSDYIIKQWEMLNGSLSENTQERDFLSLKILITSVDEQIRLCKEDSRAGLKEADKKLLESAEEFRKDMHIKKHAVGQTLANLNNWWRILQRARNNSGGILRDTDVVGISTKFEVSEIFDNLNNIIRQLQIQISKFDRGNGLKVEEFALTDFIEKYISTHKNPQFRFIYESSAHRATIDVPAIDIDGVVNDFPNEVEYALREGDPLEYVTFAPEALSIIFDNIISNACSHGFKDMDPSNCLIKIDVLSKGTDYVVVISNNGHPISEQVSIDDIFRYGITTNSHDGHFGIGSYEVKQLMLEFGGDVKITSDPKEKFAVSYLLFFHNTNIILSA